MSFRHNPSPFHFLVITCIFFSIWNFDFIFRFYWCRYSTTDLHRFVFLLSFPIYLPPFNVVGAIPQDMKRELSSTHKHYHIHEVWCKSKMAKQRAASKNNCPPSLVNKYDCHREHQHALHRYFPDDKAPKVNIYASGNPKLLMKIITKWKY